VRSTVTFVAIALILATCGSSASPTGPSSSAAATPATASTAASASGSITGRLTYPSDFIPPLQVYAISVQDPKIYFTANTPRYPLVTNSPPQPTYTISAIPPGTYYVLAWRVDSATEQAHPGVYSFAVFCGMTASCTDHRLAPIDVGAGQTVTGIDVADWYYPPTQSYPPRPR